MIYLHIYEKKALAQRKPPAEIDPRGILLNPLEQTPPVIRKTHQHNGPITHPRQKQKAAQVRTLPQYLLLTQPNCTTTSTPPNSTPRTPSRPPHGFQPKRSTTDLSPPISGGWNSFTKKSSTPSSILRTTSSISNSWVLRRDTSFNALKPTTSPANSKKQRNKRSKPYRKALP